jgi:tryptophan-rich sensory protein
VIAVAGWRVWHSERNSRAIQMWWAQLAQIGLACGVILLMLVAILGIIATAWRLDRAAAWFFVPYAAWVRFASLLNGAIWMMN